MTETADYERAGVLGTHGPSHEKNGNDEISVLALSGLLADDQHVLDAEVKLIKLDDFASPDDNPDLNASASKHGLLRKLSNVVTEFLNGQGGFSVPAGAGGVGTSGTPVANDIALFVDANTIEGKSFSELLALLSGQFGAAFDFADQNLINVGAIALDGGQIAFPATAVPSADPNTLDDYEEGTWTPVYEGSGGSIGATAYDVQTGTYTKIARLVFIDYIVDLSNNGDWTGNAYIVGIPFAPGANNVGTGYTENVTYDGQIKPHVNVGNYVRFITAKTGIGAQILQTGGVPDDGRFNHGASYIT